MNFEQVSQELKIRPEILKRLIVSFANTMTIKMKDLEEALGKMDVTAMRAILHEIKGTAGNLRLTDVCTAENVMHEAVKAGEGKEKLDGYFVTLKLRSDELQQFIAKQES